MTDKKKSSSFIIKIIIAIIIGSILGLLLTYNSFTVLLLRLLLTFGDLFSQFLGFFVPLVVLGLTLPGIIDLGNKASKMLIYAIILAFSSLMFVGLMSMVIGYSFIPTLFHSIVIGQETNQYIEYSGFLPTLLTPFFDVVAALVLAFAFGISGAVIQSEKFTSLARDIEKMLYMILNSFIIPLLPFYIASVFARLASHGDLIVQLKNFAMIIFSIFIIANLWTLIFISITAKTTKRSILEVLKSFIPAYFVALGTQSSKATIPVTLESCKEVGISKEVAEFGVPLLATVHLMGSMITQVFGSLAIYYIFMGEMLSVSLMFSYLFVLATILLAAPGVPGGEPVATKPLLTSYLGFPPVVAETMFTLGLANDSFATAVNVSSDGPVLMLLDKISKKIKK